MIPYCHLTYQWYKRGKNFGNGVGEVGPMTGGTKQAGVVAWLIAVMVPPAVAGGLGQQFVAHHAAWAIVIGVAYEAAVIVSAFFSVITRDVSSRWQKRIADRVDLFLLRKAAHFKRRYRELVLGGLRFMDHKGLATAGPYPPELDEVFVNVSLVPRPPQRIGRGILTDLADEQAGQRRVLEDFLGRRKPAVLAVVGGPGSGKTTLLRRAAREPYLRRRWHLYWLRHVRDIPILLYLRDHAAAITSDPNVSLAALVRKTLGDASTGEPPQWFEQQLRKGRCLVLLDGLDEVARQDDRAKVSAWTEMQVRQYPRNDFVISSRPQGYQSAPVEGAIIVQVCGFTAIQVETFVRSWYRAVERHSIGTDGQKAEPLANQGAGDLLTRLEHAPALHDLTVNPLLLTMIVNVHRYGDSSLPGSRAELYRDICAAMLSRRQDAKNLPQQLTGDRKETVLRGLAYRMMKRHVTDLSRKDVLASVRSALRRVSRDVTPEGFLDDVISNGLLIERKTGKYAFAHKTFQEYLAAEHIRVNGLASDLADTVSEDWWVETTLLYAATSNVDLIVRACLDANSAPALTLALDCTGQDSDVAPELRERINELIVSAAEPDADQARRRLSAGILLVTHMRQRERTAGGNQICTRPVPAEIYRLFLADTGTPEPDVPQTESGIAVGMRGDDAAEFVRWASAIHADWQNYRLPLVAELEEIAARQRIPSLPSGQLPCVWAQAEASAPGVSPVLCQLPGAAEPYQFSNALLGDYVADDMDRVPFMLSTLLLRSHIMTRALGRALTRADNLKHFLVRDLAETCDVADELLRSLTSGHYFSGMQYLNSELSLSGNLAQRLRYALASILDHTRGFNLQPEQIDSYVSAYSSEIDLKLKAAHDLVNELGRLTRVLYSDLTRSALDIIGEVDAVIDQYFQSTSCPDHIKLAVSEACRRTIGRVFAKVLLQALGSSSRSGEWAARFVGSFADVTKANNLNLVITEPAALAALVQESLARLSNELEIGPWASAAAERLRRSTQPILARTERLTPESATSIRMTALCLAGEANEVGARSCADIFREVAAGITYLQRRVNGDQEATEVIMLALGQPASGSIGETSI
jgi:hypothetical protein